MQVLGTESFLSTPDVNGQLVMLNGGGTGTVSYGTLAARPAASTAGNLYVDTTSNYIWQDTGAAWVQLSTGTVLQTVTGTIAATAGTSVISTAVTLTPLLADGVTAWTRTFTPLVSTSRLVITYALTVAHGTAARNAITSVFAGSTNIGSAAGYMATANTPASISFHIVYAPGSTATITFTAKVGSTGSGTIAVSQVNSTTGTLGGAAASEYTIMEIL
jgi:hypothetical protein